MFKTVLSCIWILSLVTANAKKLPIYIEDSHAGSFRFFAQNLDLDKSYTLILIDEHSDASGIPNSDHIRSEIRRVSSDDQRRDRIDKLRANGVIQPFNWIEPLMPKPISKVIWIAGDSLTDKQIAEKEKEARIHLDWHTQAEPRIAGNLERRYIVTDWQRFIKQIQQQPQASNLGDLIVSIDLDYFVNFTNPTTNLQQKWQSVIKWEGLHAVSFALSMPWQKDKATADSLLQASFEHALSVSNAEIQFEPYLTDLKDRSEKAKSYFKKGLTPSRYLINTAPGKLKELLVRKQDSISVTHNPLAWEAQLREWNHSVKKHELEIRSAQQSIDNVWRIRSDQLDDIWLKSPSQKIVKVKWWLHLPTQDCYNIIPQSQLGKGFTEQAPAYVSSERRLMVETEDMALSSSTWRKFLHTDLGIGIVKIQAEIVSKSGSAFSEVIEIRVRKQDGFIGALEEQFGSPYVFGIGRFKRSGESGPETLLGNDCANFLIYAKRKTGIRIPWCNPAQIKQFLEPVNGTVKLGDIIHLGSHVAVLYEDKGTLGSLDENDIIVHHLSGFPEFTELKNLLKGSPYKVMRWRRETTSTKITIGGDVCLNGKTKPLKSNVMIANLECVISDHAKPIKTKPFNYIVSSLKADPLKRFRLLSLANNHAGDGGRKGLNDTISYLESNNIDHVGAGVLADATQAKILSIDGQKIAFIALNLIEKDLLPADEKSLGVATYPNHKMAIQQSIIKARESGADSIIALPHWGDEYTTKVNPEQRSCAKWLIEKGVDIIVGSHPHREQHSEFYRGRLIVYSMGNLIFSPQNKPGFNSRSVLSIELSNSGKFLKHHRQ